MKIFVALGDPSPLPKQTLINRGYSVIDLPRFSLLSGPVSSHCDMLFTTLRGKLFTSETYYETARNQMDFIANANGFDIVLDPHSELSHYPDEARFNVLNFGDYVICNTKTVSPLIKNEFFDSGVKVLHVNQGYTACSTAICGNGMITADNSICNVAFDNGISILKIREGHIELPGYSYGFIGGASGYCKASNTLYFNGKIEDHPDFADIKGFADERGVNLVSLGDWPLFDCGGMFFFA